MNRRSGLGASLAFVSLSLVWTALAESGTAALATGVLAAIVGCLGAGLLSGVVAPDADLDEELRPTARRAFVALLLVGGASLLLLSFLS